MKWLKNVKLEVGNQISEDGLIETKTDFFHLGINEGKLVEQRHYSKNVPEQDEVIDANGLLAIPTFKEMHNHLDKTYLSLDWKACKPVKNLKERLAFEAQELSDLAPSAKQRAMSMIEKILSNGSTHIRTHVNIDPYIGLKNLEGVLEALEEYKHAITADVIAFPQHGLLRDDVPKLMREAMQNGANMVGGLDPAGIDRSIEKSLYETMEMAIEFNADVDIHLHDGGHVGYYTIDKWMDFVEEANWQNRSAISHAFCIGEVPEIQQKALAERLKENGVAIMSTIPLTKSLPPIELLDDHGVNVHLGCDGFYDSWSPHGNGDVLEKVQKFAQISRRSEEVLLRESLKWATGGITALTKDGEYRWPKIEDDASFIFVDASSSAEVVARRPYRKAIMKNGEMVYGSLSESFEYIK
ncbi:cytosine/adenosine deaminase-related metal-dependent hydrolase [Bacillus pakistanensis]|uniref:Cytosine/adenosine deaminase-related metal-dependent hydrolase n=1 Tax=Rossellomorea pakistanensis TaxID=992288 RepID=A0ABS2ND18_9BACI|nr:amidohydrolase [Bacillus pakistanensis]MBM7585713.1 cytosine/adenosine deaminase-related metal-dependent hydrolase [Bacillus pakistanensis]